jgi:hypothetical protein
MLCASDRRRADITVKAITVSLVALVAAAGAAFADDEIQIYNAQIAAVGQWTFQQHLNYTFNGRKEPATAAKNRIFRAD